MTNVRDESDLGRLFLRIEMGTLPRLTASAVRMLVDNHQGQAFYLETQSGAEDAALLLHAQYITRDRALFKVTEAGRRRVITEGVAAARNLRLKGEALTTIAEKLNHAGFPTPAGARWTARAVVSVLKRYNTHTDNPLG